MAAPLPPLTRSTLRGVWCALIVPWTETDELDPRRWAEEIRSYAGTGVHGVYTGGTTGEFHAQDDGLFAELARIGCAEAHGIGLPIQLGVTALSTRTVRKRIEIALAAKADAVQVALPFWLELKDDEVKRFVREVAAAAAPTPLVLYLTNRSKRKIAPELMAEIAAEVPTFVGTKDTGLTVPALRAMLRAVPDLAVFGGEDFFEKVPFGGGGGYCSVTGFNARKVVEFYTLCAGGKLDRAAPLARAFHRYLHEAVIPMISVDGLPDQAVDRIQRVAGGGTCGLRCQSPYRSGTAAHVTRLSDWCRRHTPEILPTHLA